MKKTVKFRVQGYLLKARIANRRACIRLIEIGLRYTKEEARLLEIADDQLDSTTKKNTKEVLITEENLLHQSVGHALSHWATFEGVLVLIGATLIETSSERSGIIFYSITNFSVWINIISELFSLSSFPKSTYSKWNKIADRSRKLKDTRDRLAHHTSINIERGILDFPTIAVPRLDLRIKSTKYKPLSSVEILFFTESVGDLMQETLKLLDDLITSGRLVLQGASPDTTTDPPHSTDVQ